MNFAFHLTSGFKDLVWPRACLACGRTTTDPILCEQCRASSKRVPGPGECPASEPVRPAMAVWKFDLEEPIRMVLHRLKYGNCPWIGLHLGARIAEWTPPCPQGDWDLIVPIPLHPRRLLERGYNQSDWIARGVGESVHVPVAPTALKRRRNTRTQTDLSREDRPSNVNGAFAIDEEAGLEGANILLVDDTLTTGATLTEAARMLVEAGVSYVQPVAVAFATLRMGEEQPEGGPVIPSRHQPPAHELAPLGHNL